MSRLIDENTIIKMLNTMDRYTSEELTLCDTDETFPKNEVFIVDDVFEGLDELPSAQPELYCAPQPDLSDDGTLMMTVPNGMLDVKRVMVDEISTKNCEVMCQDALIPEQECEKYIFKPFKQFRPERKKGEWIHKPDIYLDEQTWECSECGEPWIFIEGTPSENNANFCPNCGAEMEM